MVDGETASDSLLIQVMKATDCFLLESQFSLHGEMVWKEIN